VVQSSIKREHNERSQSLRGIVTDRIGERHFDKFLSCVCIKMRELLMRLMESPEIAGVVMAEFSRLMRPENFTDYCLLQDIIDTGCILYSPEGPIDLASATGQLVGPALSSHLLIGGIWGLMIDAVSFLMSVQKSALIGILLRV
jgi:hypothetical protein